MKSEQKLNERMKELREKQVRLAALSKRIAKKRLDIARIMQAIDERLIARD